MQINKDLYSETAAYLAACIKNIPDTAIILGSGLGSLADEIEDARAIPYRQIPNFMASTATGHKGNLIHGRLTGNKESVGFKCGWWYKYIFQDWGFDDNS